MGDYWFWLVLLGGILAWKVLVPQLRAKQRRAYLVSKYGEEDGERLFKNTVWEGMTDEMVIDLLGKPSEIKHAFVKGKTTQRWRYFDSKRRVTRHSFTFEEGVVTGWTVKEEREL